jgi:protease-4
MRRAGGRWWAALATAALLGPSTADAQMRPERVGSRPSDPIPLPGRSIAGVDEAAATALNPANLALLPGPELRWTWVDAPDLSPLPGRGHALDAAAPLWILGTGLRIERHDPTPSVLLPSAEEFAWIRWGAGVRLSDTLSVGSSLGWSLSSAASLDGMFGATFGMTSRPTDWVSTSIVARDVNEPVAQDGTVVPRAWEAGIALRPYRGRRELELGLDARYVDRFDRTALKATLGVDVPHLGRFRTEAQWLNVSDDVPAVAATAGLELGIGALSLGGGPMFGNAMGAVGGYATAAIRGYREETLPMLGPARIVRLSIDSTPGVRGHVRLLRKLWRLADRDDVDGVLLELEADPASSMAHAEELGDALRTLRARGKRSVCQLKDASGKALLVCSQADRIAIHPAGGVRFAGVSSRYTYLGGLLDRLGIRADFVRIGAHKTAAELYALDGGTDVARADHQALVDRYAEHLLHDIGGGRQISLRRMRAVADGGPYLSDEARDRGLVDALVYPDEIDAYLEQVFARPVVVRGDLPLPDAPARWRSAGRVAIVYLAGDMVDGESRNIPIIGLRLAGSRTIAEALTAAREDRSIKAVVFRIETGGGSSLAADVLLREAKLTAEKKPMVISMGTAAASGGYYAAVGGGRIWANRSTVTGSIGIFYGKVDLSALLGRLGVGQDAFRSNPRADLESLFRPFSDEERVVLGEKIKRSYDLFVGHVAEGRRMSPEAVDAVARGRVWTGAEAREHGLVDAVGGLREALDEARALGGLDADAPIVELPEEDDSLLGFLLDLAGVSSTAPIASLVPAAMLDAARVLAPFVVYDDARPLARTELFEMGAFSGNSSADDPRNDEDDR